MTLSPEQYSAVETKEPKAVIIAGCGTGKTRTLTERLIYLLDSGYDPSKICAVTFTNMAAEEMRQRIGERADKCYIGTIHGLANKILLSNGISTADLIENENFDLMFDLIQENNCTFPKIEHLLVDEFQDTGTQEFNFLINVLQPENYFVVGDPCQKIYSFKTGPTDYFLKLVNDPYTYVYTLTENYRSYTEIINFAKSILNRTYIPNRTNLHCARGNGGYITQAEFMPSTLINAINNRDTYKDWFVLARTNEEVNMLVNLLNKANIPTITFKKAEKTLEELQKELQTEAVKVLTIHTAKGLESKNVAVIGAHFWNDEERRIGYVAATRAQNYLLWFDNNNKKRKKQSIVMMNHSTAKTVINNMMDWS